MWLTPEELRVLLHALVYAMGRSEAFEEEARLTLAIGLHRQLVSWLPRVEAMGVARLHAEGEPRSPKEARRATPGREDTPARCTLEVEEGRGGD